MYQDIEHNVKTSRIIVEEINVADMPAAASHSPLRSGALTAATAAHHAIAGTGGLVAPSAHGFPAKKIFFAECKSRDIGE